MFSKRGNCALCFITNICGLFTLRFQQIVYLCSIWRNIVNEAPSLIYVAATPHTLYPLKVFFLQILFANGVFVVACISPSRKISDRVKIIQLQNKMQCKGMIRKIVKCVVNKFKAHIYNIRNKNCFTTKSCRSIW